MKRKFRVLAALVLALLLCVGAACAGSTRKASAIFSPAFCG